MRGPGGLKTPRAPCRAGHAVSLSLSHPRLAGAFPRGLPGGLRSQGPGRAGGTPSKPPHRPEHAKPHRGRHPFCPSSGGRRGAREPRPSHFLLEAAPDATKALQKKKKTHTQLYKTRKRQCPWCNVTLGFSSLYAAREGAQSTTGTKPSLLFHTHPQKKTIKPTSDNGHSGV